MNEFKKYKDAIPYLTVLGIIFGFIIGLLTTNRAVAMVPIIAIAFSISGYTGIKIVADELQLKNTILQSLSFYGSMCLSTTFFCILLNKFL